MATTVDTLFNASVSARPVLSSQERQAVQLNRQLADQRVVWLRDPLDPSASTFVAPNPQLALDWICQHGLKTNVLKWVKASRKRGREDDAGDDDDDGDSSSSKRRATTTVSNHNRARLKRAEEKERRFVYECFHNSQEAAEEAVAQYKLDIEQASLLRYLGGQPEASNAGTKVMSTLVRKLASIGSASALEDLRLALREWRASTCQRTPASSQDTVRRAAVPSASHSALSAQDQCFHRYYEASERAGQLGAMSAIQRRYYDARLYAEYQRRLELVEQAGTSVAKRGASEQVHLTLFRIVRPHSRLRTTDPLWRHSTEWQAFRRRISKHGRRWWELEQAYTVGIFALLPRTDIPSTYVERTLTDSLFALFVRAIVRRPHVSDMAQRLAPVLTAAVEGKPPPTYRLELETLAPDEIQLLHARAYPELLEPVDEQHPRVIELRAEDDPITLTDAFEHTSSQLGVRLPRPRDRVLVEDEASASHASSARPSDAPDDGATIPHSSSAWRSEIERDEDQEDEAGDAGDSLASTWSAGHSEMEGSTITIPDTSSAGRSVEASPEEQDQLDDALFDGIDST